MESDDRAHPSTPATDPVGSASEAALDEGLTKLQTALQGRRFYGENHPLILGATADAVEQFRLATTGHPTIVVARLGDRVVAEGRRLPSEQILRRGLFERLRLAGFDTLTIEARVCEDDLNALLDSLDTNSTPADAQTGPLRPGHLAAGSRHARDAGAGFVDEDLVQDPRRGVNPSDSPLQLLAPVGQTFHSILTGEALEDASLDVLVDQLGQAARVGSGALLSMQSLKRHDDYTFAHAVNVGILSSGLAAAAGLPETSIRDITLAGMLHDAGKERVPADLLSKPGRLSGAEFAVIQSHPIEGARLLVDAEGVPPLAAIAAYEHHMNADGSGYPQVSPGYRRHPASEMVQLADVFDALRTRRSYREALPLAKVHEIILEGRGTHYDPALVDLFLSEVVGDLLPTDDVPATPEPTAEPRARAA